MYLNQYIREEQVKYPLIHKTPFQVMSNLLFGCNETDSDGNFLKLVELGRRIPFSCYFSTETSTETCIKLFEQNDSDSSIDFIDYNLSRINDMFKRIAKEKVMSEDEVRKKAISQYYSRYDNVSFIDQYDKTELLLISDVWYEMINNSEYNLYLDLKTKKFSALNFTDKTDEKILLVSIAIFQAVIKKMKEILNDNSLLNKKLIFKNQDEENERILKSYETDVKILEKEYERIRSILFDNKSYSI